MGANAWADTKIGATGNGWTTAGSYTTAATLSVGETRTFTFTVDNLGTTGYDSYCLNLSKLNTPQVFNTDNYFFIRSSDFWYTIGDEGTTLVGQANTFGETSVNSVITGATVVMTVSRVGNKVLVSEDITTTSSVKYYHTATVNIGTTDDIYAFLAADYAVLTVTGDVTTDNGLTEEAYDFSANKPGANVNCTTTGYIDVNGTSSNIIANTQIEMNDRFAAQFGSGSWMMHKDNALYSVNSGGRKFAVLKLKANDRVVITFPDGYAPTFTGTPNAYIAASGDISDGTALVSGMCYTIKSDGMFALEAPKYGRINSVTIYTSAPVLSKPTVSFNNMVESDGLYYPQVTISGEDGVTFKNGSDETITSPYTFTSAGTLTVYATKAGRTNSAKATYTVTDAQVGMIKANSVNASSLTGTVNYGTGSTFEYGNSAEGTWVIPGLSFGANFYNYTTRITQTGGTRSLTCTVLNENRVATINHYYYESNKTINDFLTSTNSSATFHRSGSYYDHFYQYDLYVNPSENASVTIGSTGYSTFSSPVPLNFAGIEGLTAYVAKDVADGSVKLTSVNSAPANTGLVLKGTTGETYNIPVTASAETPASNLLVGCIVETTVAKDETSKFNNYVLAIEGEEAKFQSLVTNGATIPAGKAFLKNGAYSAGGGARALNIVFGDESTGISTVNGSQSKVNGEYYNLSGQRVTAPQKGLYIVNGKKVFIK